MQRKYIAVLVVDMVVVVVGATIKAGSTSETAVISSRLHCAVSQKTVVFILASART
jgi:hypothetical protein